MQTSKPDISHGHGSRGLAGTARVARGKRTTRGCGGHSVSNRKEVVSVSPTVFSPHGLDMRLHSQPRPANRGMWVDSQRAGHGDIT